MNKKKLTTMLIISIIILSFLLVDWENNNFHNNGFVIIKEMANSAISPDLSILDKAFFAIVITVVYASVGMSVALLMGFILSIFATNILHESRIISKLVTDLLAAMRAVHELVWALFFVASIGFSPFSAIFAIAIPYTGMLGKVFTDIFKSVSYKKIDALKQIGASPLQILFYGYLPEAYYDLISYSLYRYECAIRSSTILSFVGLGGIGLKIQLSLNDMKLNEMFTYVYALITLVLVLDVWGNLYRKKREKGKISVYLFSFIILLSWVYVVVIDKGYITDIFNQKNLRYSLDFLSKLVGINHENPAFLNTVEIKKVFILMLETLQMSIISITIASLLMIITVIFATRQYSKKILFYILRGIYLVSRAVPELIWAMIIVFIIKPGIIAGALALAIHNFGILSKLCAEVIEELDQRPLSNLRVSGAGKFQVLLYGVIPMVSSRFISYIIYRWEIILRTTIVVGFVGAGGLGYYFRLGMSFFHYTEVMLVLLFYLVLVQIADKVANKLNKIYST